MREQKRCRKEAGNRRDLIYSFIIQRESFDMRDPPVSCLGYSLGVRGDEGVMVGVQYGCRGPEVVPFGF